MYEVDRKDRLEELQNVPQSSVGAPIPMLIANEFLTALVFYLNDTPADWDGSQPPRILGAQSEGEPLAIVSFRGCCSHMFGPPNDEAISGHPLAGRGLYPYGAFRVESSSWIRRLERMNAVHPYHKPERFARLSHYIWTFHDSTFECLANEFSIETVIASTCDGLMLAFQRMTG